MNLNPILIDGFAIAVKVGSMTLEQVPIPYQKPVKELLEMG